LRSFLSFCNVPFSLRRLYLQAGANIFNVSERFFNSTSM
jgi:hypothetical protein